MKLQPGPLGKDRGSKDHSFPPSCVLKWEALCPGGVHSAELTEQTPVVPNAPAQAGHSSRCGFQSWLQLKKPTDLGSGVPSGPQLEPICRGAANSGPRANFVNKVLLEHSSTCVVCGCFCAITSELSRCSTVCGPQRLARSLSGLFPGKVCQLFI